MNIVREGRARQRVSPLFNREMREKTRKKRTGLFLFASFRVFSRLCLKLLLTEVSQKAVPFNQHPADVRQNRYGLRFAQLGIRNVQ
jgi:hypothetical protein